MSLESKLNEIRSKPEHVRQRYVWAGVVLCMIFVLMIWLFTVKTNFSTSSSDSTDTFTEIQEQFNASGGEELPKMPSIEDYVTTDERHYDSGAMQDPYKNVDTQTGSATVDTNSGASPRDDQDPANRATQ